MFHRKLCFFLKNISKNVAFVYLFVCLTQPDKPLMKASIWTTAQETDCDPLWPWIRTYRSIWGSRRSAPWSGQAWCPAPPGACAASHRGHSRRPCRPGGGTPAAAPPGGWWSRTLAGQCCCIHLWDACFRLLALCRRVKYIQIYILYFSRAKKLSTISLISKNRW